MAFPLNPQFQALLAQGKSYYSSTNGSDTSLHCIKLVKNGTAHCGSKALSVNDKQVYCPNCDGSPFPRPDYLKKVKFSGNAVVGVEAVPATKVVTNIEQPKEKTVTQPQKPGTISVTLSIEELDSLSMQLIIPKVLDAIDSLPPPNTMGESRKLIALRDKIEKIGKRKAKELVVNTSEE